MLNCEYLEQLRGMRQTLVLLLINMMVSDLRIRGQNTSYKFRMGDKETFKGLRNAYTRRAFVRVPTHGNSIVVEDSI